MQRRKLKHEFMNKSKLRWFDYIPIFGFFTYSSRFKSCTKDLPEEVKEKIYIFYESSDKIDFLTLLTIIHDALILFPFFIVFPFTYRWWHLLSYVFDVKNKEEFEHLK